MIDEHLQKKIREARTRANLSQVELAKLLNVCDQSVYHWETGRRAISNKIIEQIPAVKSLGLDKLTWHCLRHTCATRALLAGATLHEVSRLLGHSSIHQTERYVHFLEEHLWPAARALCRNNEGKR